ncbi:MAG: thioredoxin family protein [Calditrichaeota bacterium]|nr:thioredoxin family protein [Calditrichota bacterium]
MIIEVLGPGCARCEKTYAIVQKAASELGLKEGEDYTVTKIKEPTLIAQRGVLMTPGVAIDGMVKSSGRIPSPEQVKQWLSES